MTDKPRDGGPAFAHGNPEQGGDTGMSLRDYFAGQALAKSMSSYVDRDNAAHDAYLAADAMLKARDE